MRIGGGRRRQEREKRERRERLALSLFPQHFFLQKHSPQASSILIKFLSQAYSLLNFSRHLSLLPFYTNIMSLPPSSLLPLFIFLIAFSPQLLFPSQLFPSTSESLSFLIRSYIHTYLPLYFPFSPQSSFLPLTPCLLLYS